MTFQIIDLSTREAVRLSEFDNLYCKFLNIPVQKNFYAEWFTLLERALQYYGNIADNCKGSRIYDSLIKEARVITPKQLVQALLISEAEDIWYYELRNCTMQFIKFLKANNKFYITFHF